MKRDFFKVLPPEIITNILSRLSVRSVGISKCVCKPWLHLLETDYFLNSHLSNSAARAIAVMIPEEDTNWCKIFELEDKVDLESQDPIAKVDFPHGSTIEGSANGLLLLHMLYENNVDFLYVCNPITRQLSKLHSHPQGVSYGFGARKITGQHKVVSISHKSRVNPNAKFSRHVDVYTLGTGSWRRVEGTVSFNYCCSDFGVFANGNLHWIVSSSQSDANKWVFCFDVEKECFSTFPAPPHLQSCCLPWRLFTFRGCLCFCDDSSDEEIVVWVMKDYEVEKSWTKEYVIPVNTDHGADVFEFVRPIKIFGHGDFLMMCDSKIFVYYLNETGTYKDSGLYLDLVLLTPSFLSLKSFRMENVVSY